MPAFPRHSIAWKFEQRTLQQRVTQALPAYGFFIGFVGRVYRWGVLSILVLATWTSVIATIAIGLVLMCALATGHFANYSVRSWRWRAPALGAFVALGESVTSLALILLHQERGGHALTTLADWPGATMDILLTRELAICLFALVLAGVVVALRKQLEPDAPAGGTP